MSNNAAEEAQIRADIQTIADALQRLDSYRVSLTDGEIHPVKELRFYTSNGKRSGIIALVTPEVTKTWKVVE